MGRLYNWLGLSVGTIVNQQDDEEKRSSYRSDICYGQNNEFGFDYLRDNMKYSALDYAQRRLNFAIVDEVDSILIDEARTPLIISGPAEAASEKYRTLNEVVAKLQQGRALQRRREGVQRHPHRRGRRVRPEARSASRNLYDPGQRAGAAHPEPAAPRRTRSTSATSTTWCRRTARC